MEIGEAVTAMKVAVASDTYCKGVATRNNGWSSRIDSYTATPTPAELCANMKKEGLVVPAEPNQIDGLWDLKDCGVVRYPFQSHHLIPKKHLPKHNVCVWLTAKCTKDPEYVLTEDTNFDTDHARNGYFMPFASNLYQWKKAKNELEKASICNELMTRTRVQLHQGSHTAEDYAGEVEGIETGGYLSTIDDLLDIVDGAALNHVESCSVCATGSNKIKVQPLESVVSHVYSVAQTTKTLVDSNRIFVSERAAAHWMLNPR